MITYTIYKATNSENDKSYIGVTIRTLKQRIYQHMWTAQKRKSRCHFHQALRKYPRDVWVWSILEVGTGIPEYIRERERHFIKEFGTYINDNYNSTPGGEEFSSSEYQRELQQFRVRNGTHPFLGGNIQRESGRRRWMNGSHNLIGNNQIRIANGTHPFLGSNNPLRRRKAAGMPHHNQQKPWNNTKAKNNNAAWAIADQLHQWFLLNRHKQRGGGYTAMAVYFHLKPSSLMKIYYDYFLKGWDPLQDREWINSFRPNCIKN